MKILTVDDSAIQRRIISGIVIPLGYECIEASNGLEALNILKQDADEFSLIILDWNMPIMDGLTFLQEKKKIVSMESIPTVMVTTESGRGNMIEAIRAGAKAYLSKPFTPEELTVKLVQVLENAN